MVKQFFKEYKKTDIVMFFPIYKNFNRILSNKRKSFKKGSQKVLKSF